MDLLEGSMSIALHRSCVCRSHHFLGVGTGSVDDTGITEEWLLRTPSMVLNCPIAKCAIYKFG